MTDLLGEEDVGREDDGAQQRESVANAHGVAVERLLAPGCHEQKEARDSEKNAQQRVKAGTAA